MTTSKHNPYVEYFDSMVKRGKLTAQDAADFSAGKKQFIDDEIYIRKALTGLKGVVEFINENDVQKNCITNLSKGRVPEEKNIIVSHIGIRLGFSPTAGVDPADIAYSGAIFNIQDMEFDAGGTATGGDVYARAIPVAFQNAEYVLKCDSETIDMGRVVDMLTHNVSVDGVNGHDKNFKQLKWPKMLIAGKRLTLDLKFPDTATPAPAGYFFAELIVKGLGLGKREAA